MKLSEPVLYRWVDIDQLDLAEVSLLQHLEYFQIFALDKDVLRFIEVDRQFTLAGAVVALEGVCSTL